MTNLIYADGHLGNIRDTGWNTKEEIPWDWE